MNRTLSGGLVRLGRLHGRAEKVSATLQAIGLVVTGTVTAIGGLRALFEIMVPEPEEQPSED